MTPRVTVAVDISDLERVVWEFYYYVYEGAVLDAWEHQTRKTKRHKFRASQWGKTAWERGSRDERFDRIPRPDVPDDVKAEALRKFRESVCMNEGE